MAPPAPALLRPAFLLLPALDGFLLDPLLLRLLDLALLGGLLPGLLLALFLALLLALLRASNGLLGTAWPGWSGLGLLAGLLLLLPLRRLDLALLRLLLRLGPVLPRLLLLLLGSFLLLTLLLLLGPVLLLTLLALLLLLGPLLLAFLLVRRAGLVARLLR